MSTILNDVKLALRIKNNAFDEEINDLIESAKLDLGLSGVTIILEEDQLIKQAIKLYCKANFGYSEDSEKFAKAYEGLRTAICLGGEYNV